MGFIRTLKDTRGSLAVEVAIFLPVFIIGILTLGYLIKLVAVEENVYHSFNDEMRKVAAHASIDPTGYFGPGDIEKRVGTENPTEVTEFNVASYKYSSLPADGIIRATIDYKVRVKLPVKLVGDIPVSDTIVCRGFVGGKAPIDPMSFAEMEERKDSDEVWIFPRSGEKYHGENCSYIAVNPKERMLSSSVRGRYSPCKLCKPGNLSNGNLVYCFTQSGHVYHRGSCTTVDRYVVSIEKKEAEQRGYTPCSKCGGG